jgi:NAD(P)-dependent dehydrogenase (short-subunit alcohol dehydrogenase family)
MSSYAWSLIGAVVVVGLTFGIPLFLAEYFPWRSLYQQRHGRPVPTTESYAGRTALITGANGAFGSRAAKMFALRGVATLVLADVRDCGDVKRAIEAELAAAGRAERPTILVWQIDMMTYAGCRELARRARAELQHLDHALMTAGILAFERRLSPEGWETSVQVNFLSTALNGLLLLPLLRASPSNPNPPVLTFVTTFGIYPSSFTMGLPKQRGASYLARMSESKGDMAQAHQYGRSKGLLLYFARELAARVAATAAAKGLKPPVTVNSADPGSAWTPLTNPNQAKLIPRLIMNFGARDPQICATALVNGVSAPAGAHGKIMQDFDTTG